MSLQLTTEITLSDSGFLFDHSTGSTFTLNPTGQFILKQIQHGVEREAILPAILDEFEIDDAVARKDLDDFFRALKDVGILS